MPRRFRSSESRSSRPRSPEGPRRLSSGRPGSKTTRTRRSSRWRCRSVQLVVSFEHSADAPSAYPHIHHVTAPLRRAARAAGDPDAINLWAGEAYSLAEEAPAGELVPTPLGSDAQPPAAGSAQRQASRDTAPSGLGVARSAPRKPGRSGNDSVIWSPVVRAAAYAASSTYPAAEHVSQYAAGGTRGS